MASYHISNFGMFSVNIPCDIDGYTHTTADEWLAAPVGAPRSERTVEWAEEMASSAIEAIASAEAAIAEWQAA